MKATKYFFMLALAVSVSFISCETEDTESCDAENLSDDFNCPTSVDAVATFCSDGVNNSYYTFGGTDYQCTGVEASTCDAAIQAIGAKLIEAGCSGKKSGSIDAANIKLTAMAEKLLEEVRTKSLCQ
ncbi:MAG: hypothetical protein M0P66_12180 [Salinivirgaceae bacterium]|nr:hypothetical protein [Salinivirgaceae bacterium]